MRNDRETVIKEIMRLTSLDRRTLETIATESLVELLKTIKEIE